jgi:hypothetical protein
LIDVRGQQLYVSDLGEGMFEHVTALADASRHG